MKLLRKNPDGTLEVVPAETLRGTMDAWEVARKMGDGEYIADFLDGSYLPFRIANGQPQGGVSLDDVQYGKPYETTSEGGRFRDGNANSFYNLVPDVVGTEEPAGNAWDEYASG